MQLFYYLFDCLQLLNRLLSLQKLRTNIYLIKFVHKCCMCIYSRSTEAKIRTYMFNRGFEPRRPMTARCMYACEVCKYSYCGSQFSRRELETHQNSLFVCRYLGRMVCMYVCMYACISVHVCMYEPSTVHVFCKKR